MKKHWTSSSLTSGGWSERTLPLANVLLTPWAMFQGASEEVIERAKEEGDKELLTQGGTALEVSRPVGTHSSLLNHHREHSLYMRSCLWGC